MVTFVPCRKYKMTERVSDEEFIMHLQIIFKYPMYLYLNVNEIFFKILVVYMYVHMVNGKNISRVF